MLYTSAIPGITQIHATADDPSKNSHVHYVGDTRFAFENKPVAAMIDD
jgi:hypothetical protein